MLNYKSFGKGRPLIILHGFLGSLDNWLTLGKKFGENFNVYLIDQRNHGKSFHSEEWGYDEMVTDLESFIDHFELEKPILLGHSMGGKTVMQYTAFHDSEVSKLIVADIGPKYYPVHHEKILEGLKSVNIDKVKNREEVDQILSEYISEPGVRTFLTKNLARTSDGFSWKMNLEVLDNQIGKIGEALSHHLPIEIETLFLRGGNSKYILDEDCEDIQEIFPNAIVQTVENAGHWLHAEQPVDFYSKVMSFIDE